MSHNTVKFLIGITPQGSISYISHGWGGRTSDKFITENCGLLKRLLPGDQLLADRGFTVADSVGMYGAELVILSFTKGKKQLPREEVEKARQILSLYPRGASDWFASAEVYHSPVNTPYLVGQARWERWRICLTWQKCYCVRCSVQLLPVSCAFPLVTHDQVTLNQYIIFFWPVLSVFIFLFITACRKLLCQRAWSAQYFFLHPWWKAVRTVTFTTRQVITWFGSKYFCCLFSVSKEYSKSHSIDQSLKIVVDVIFAFGGSAGCSHTVVFMSGEVSCTGLCFPSIVHMFRSCAVSRTCQVLAQLCREFHTYRFMSQWIKCTTSQWWPHKEKKKTISCQPHSQACSAKHSNNKKKTPLQLHVSMDVFTQSGSALSCV